MRDMKVVMRRKMKNILVMTKMMAMMMKSGVGEREMTQMTQSTGVGQGQGTELTDPLSQFHHKNGETLLLLVIFLSREQCISVGLAKNSEF